jgi:hypothetical protein
MVRVLLTATAFLVLILLLWEVRAILQLVLIAAFLALALNPIVTVLERRIGNRRGVSCCDHLGGERGCGHRVFAFPRLPAQGAELQCSLYIRIYLCTQ